MALYLLDTDICSYVIRNRPEAVRKRMNAIPLESQAISVVTYAELMFGVRRSSNAKVSDRGRRFSSACVGARLASGRRGCLCRNES